MSNMPKMSQAEAEKLLDEHVKNAAQKQQMMGRNYSMGLSQGTADVLKQAANLGGGIMLSAAIGGASLQRAKGKKHQLLFILDGSGSMSGKESIVLSGVNRCIDRLKDRHNPNRDRQEITIWILRNKEPYILSVMNPNDPTDKFEVARIPVMGMPHITASDYSASGGTPLNKTLLIAGGAGSLAVESGLRKSDDLTISVYLFSDGMNTLYDERVGGQNYDYSTPVVYKMVRELIGTERWTFTYASVYGSPKNPADTMRVEQDAADLGFPEFEHFDLSNMDQLDRFFENVSSSAAHVSANPNQVSGGATGFFKPVSVPPSTSP